MILDPVDALIIGAGAAGCTAAVYLQRYHRRVIVVDGGQSRLTWVPRAHNLPGYPDGVPGTDLLRQLRAQVERYGAVFQEDAVHGLVRRAKHFEATTSAGVIAARSVVLATDVDLGKPDIAGLPEAVARGIVRFCPICDGFEASGKRIVVVGRRASAIEEAHFLRTFSEHVSFYPEGSDALLDPAVAAKAKAAGITVSSAPVRRYTLGAATISLVTVEGSEAEFDVLYPCLGCVPSSQLADQLGVTCDANGAIRVDDHCRTSVAGVYAAGDVICGIDQIATAFGNGAVAATALHNDLRSLEPPDA